MYVVAARWRLVLWGALALVMLAALTGRASASGPSSADRRAMELFEQSSERYNAGRFQEAVDLLKQAYALRSDPVLLYNLARAYEGLGDLDHAMAAYADFLRAQPNAEDRGAIETRIATLRSQIEQRAALKREREAAQRERREAEERAREAPARSPSVVPWIVTGVGAAALATGAVLGAVSAARHAAAIEAPQTEIDDDQSQARHFATAANVLFASGGALAVAGVVWGIVDLRASRRADKDPEVARILPSLGLGWIGVSVRTQ